MGFLAWPLNLRFESGNSFKQLSSNLLTSRIFHFEFVTTFWASYFCAKMAGAFLRNAGAKWLLFFDILRMELAAGSSVGATYL
jgi:hypothetical protein